MSTVEAKMNDTKLRKKVFDYIARHNVLSLATIGENGLWSAAVFYVHDEARLYFLSAPHTRHCQNIAGSPQVSATIQEDYKNWEEIKGIQLSGECTLLAGEARDRAIALYSQKFPLVSDDAPAQIRNAIDKVSWYQLTIDKLYMIDNALGLGHRDEIALPNV